MTSQLSNIPYIPETAPFTMEQRAYLNGFLAGLFSQGAPPSPDLMTSRRAKKTCMVLYGSQTGNCEALAKKLKKAGGSSGIECAVKSLGDVTLEELGKISDLLIITSTYGDGEPPDNARPLWEALAAASGTPLSGVRYSVCALGDTNYPAFCQFGKDMDAKLEQLGATRMSGLAECDVDYDDAFQKWLDQALPAVGHGADRPALAALGEEDVPLTREIAHAPETSSAPLYSRKNPFHARLITSRLLSLPGSKKRVQHVAFDLSGSNLAYEAGDALGVFPRNCPELVDQVLERLGCCGEEEVLCNGETMSLGEALLERLDLSKVTPELLKKFKPSSDGVGDPLAAGQGFETNGTGNDVLDLLELMAPWNSITAQEWVSLLRPLQPRLYSIASSPRAHPTEIHLTVGVVRYERLNRMRKGVCSTFLAERAEPDSQAPVFVHSNKTFRPPPNDAPMIMVGPGTGIAPFRGFLQEREALQSPGKNWLFFGDQTSACDFLYHDEIELWRKSGVLAELDLAWSRDGKEKVYAQHLMLRRARELWSWLDDGGYFYVCGDAQRMAKDVDAALHEVVQRGGDKTPEQAEEYVSELKKTKRYCRDVY